jgi:hypothetical protein
MRYTVEKCQIDLIGPIWAPFGLVCALEKTLTSHDLENVGEWTRDNVEHWLSLHSGDFQHVQDFRADFSRKGKDWVSEWAEEESEFLFSDAMYPEED